MQEVFKEFDFDGHGQLTREELTQILCGEYCEVSFRQAHFGR